MQSARYRQLGQNRQVVGAARRRIGGDDLACVDAPHERGGREHEVETQVRLPRRKGEPRLAGSSGAEGVDVSSVEDLLDRPPSDVSATHPDEWAQPERQAVDVEQLPRRECVEVAGEHMEPGGTRRYRVDEGSYLANASGLGPGGMDGTEVHSEEVDPAARRNRSRNA
jgi:hypothetical protein